MWRSPRCAFSGGFSKIQSPWPSQHTQDGAAWLVANRPEVRLVGVDYLSVAVYDDVVGPHVVLLGNVRLTYCGKARTGNLEVTGCDCGGGAGADRGGCWAVSVALPAAAGGGC